MQRYSGLVEAHNLAQALVLLLAFLNQILCFYLENLSIAPPQSMNGLVQCETNAAHNPLL